MKSSKIKKFGNAARPVAGGLLLAPIAVVYIGICLIVGVVFFGSLLVYGVNFLLSVLGAVVGVFVALGPAATIIIGLVVAFGLLQQKGRKYRERQMQALLSTDTGVRYCNILLASRALQALPLPTDSRLDALMSDASDNIELDVLSDVGRDDRRVRTELKTRCQAITTELNAAGVDPIQFSHFILTKAAQGDLPTAMELGDELITS